MYRSRRTRFMDLTDKQRTAIGFLTDGQTHVLVFGGGANGGKSWLGCIWLLYACLAFPGTKWFMGRESLKDLRKSTLATFFKVTRACGVDPGLYHYNGQDHFIEFHNGSRIELLELKEFPSDPYFERYGSLEYTGGWIEEAGEVSLGAFDVLGTRVGRHMNDRYGLLGKILVTCNPKKNWLYREFWKPFRSGTLDPRFRFIQSLVDDNTKRESGSKEKLLAIRDNVTKQRLLFGNWDYEDDPSALMDYDAIVGIYTNTHVKPDPTRRYLTTDVARLGRDRSVIRIWHGWVVVKTVVRQKTTTDKIEALVIGLAETHGIQRRNILIDEDGIGGGVLDHVPGAKGFVANEAAHEIKGVAENYANLKSQCSFRFAEKVNAGEILILDEDEPDKAMTIEEMEQVKRRDPDSDKKIAVIQKDVMKAALGRSPDFWDSLMMRAWFEVTAPASRAIRDLPKGW